LITIGWDMFVRDPLSPNLLWLIIIDLGAFIFFIAILWHIHCTMNNLREPLITDLYVGIKKVIRVFLASILQTLIIFSALLIFFGFQILLVNSNIAFSTNPFAILLTTLFFLAQFLLVFYLISLFIFVLPLIAVENKPITLSIEQSVSLVWDHWWRVISLQLLPWIVYTALLLVLSNLLGLGIHLYFTKGGSASLLIALMNMVLFALFVPWIASLLLVQLYDLELRKMSKQLK
jgi:hypothetical protein